MLLREVESASCPVHEVVDRTEARGRSRARSSIGLRWTTPARGFACRSPRRQSAPRERPRTWRCAFKDFVYDEEGQLLTSNFYDYHVPHALDMRVLKTGAIESPSPFPPLGAKGMGEGGGGGIHCICSAIQDALCPAGRPIVDDSCNPYHRVWSMLQDREATRANVKVVTA